jgi:dehydrogenase/reductase SDR family protein 4
VACRPPARRRRRPPPRLTSSTSPGIGEGIAARLAAEGAAVVVSSRKRSAVDAAVARLRAGGAARVAGVECHVGDAAALARLVRFALDTFGPPDVLVSNAAVNPAVGGLLDLAPDAIDKILDINVKAAIALCRACVPHMPPGGEARQVLHSLIGLVSWKINYPQTIQPTNQPTNPTVNRSPPILIQSNLKYLPAGAVVFVSSYTAFNPTGPLAMYAVSKTALLGLTKALAEELAPAGLRVNCVAPGVVPTKFAAALVATPEAEAGAKARTLVGRLGTPADIAAAVA